jgi:hypothetical protein
MNYCVLKQLMIDVILIFLVYGFEAKRRRFMLREILRPLHAGNDNCDYCYYYRPD